MPIQLDPLVSEFSTQEEADSHDLWFRNKVQASLQRADTSGEPRHSSDDVLRRVEVVLQAAELRHAKRRVA